MFHWSDSGQITSVHAFNAGVLCVFYLHLLNQLPSLSENVHRATEDVPTTNFEGYNMPNILLIITKHQNMELSLIIYLNLYCLKWSSFISPDLFVGK